VFADTLFRAEQQHLLRLLVWCALSILAGTALAATLAVRRIRSPLLTQFSIQMTIWGGVFAAIAITRWTTLRLRDLSGAARLERIVWLNIGLDGGYVAAGAVLGIAAWLLGRRVGPVGAGIAVAIQGLALLVIDLQFAAAISR
jgi:hypothetical protein